LNVQSTVTGAIVKRLGLSSAFSTAADADIKSVFAVEATSSDHFLYAQDAKLFQSGSGTPLLTGQLSGYWSFVESTPQSSQGPVFLSNGVDTPKAWDGTSLTNWTRDANSYGTSGTAVPNGKYLCLQDSRVVTAGISGEDSSQIRWSDVLIGTGTLPRTWPAENVQMFDPGDGDAITGIGRCGSNLLVFKKHKTFVVYDLNTGASRRLSSTIGCTSHRSIVDTPEGTFFLSDKGVYVTNGSSLQLVSDLITPTITNATNLDLAAGKLYANHYYLSIGTMTLDYDLVLKSWWKHSTLNAVYSWASRFNNFSEEAYVAAGTKVGQWLTPDTYTDFGAAYSWYWKGPWLTPGAARVVYPADRKRLRALRVDGFGNVQLTREVDFQSGEVPVNAQSPSGGIRTSLFPVPTNTTFKGSGTYFGDFNGGTSPPTPVEGTYFADQSNVSLQARVWGQGVARAWAFNFAGSPSDLTNPLAATVQNYTIYIQERNS
jgi:hypothetical protein